MAYIVRDGVRVYFEDHGSGPGVLLTHGFNQSSTMWQDQVEVISANYRVMTWDMRGHGRSDYPNDLAAYSQDQSVADMVAIMDACGLAAAVIGGHSLGGCTSLAFHLAHPQRTAALMLFDTGPGFKEDEARAAWNTRANARADQLDAQGLEALGNSPGARLAGHRNATGLARAARGMLAQFDDSLIQSLPNIAVPTMVLVGDGDESFHAGTCYMAKNIPNVQNVVIKNSNHVANEDQPVAFNNAVLGFLGELSI